MLKTLELTMIATTVCLLASSFASAQDTACGSDADCADGERCEQGLVLVSCEVPPCPGEDAEEGAGHCVNALIGEACAEDSDCGEDLNCARTVVAIDCPQDDPDCAPEATEEDGFCADNATLAASSGLAPTAAGSDGSAGGSAPEIAEVGSASDDANTTSDPDASSAKASDGGCSIGGQTGGLNGLLPLALALVALGLRRRSSRPVLIPAPPFDELWG